MSDQQATGEKPAKEKDTRSDGELRRDIERGRDELARTLDAVEYKLDVPARGQEMLEQSKRSLLRTWDENPLLVIGLAAGAAVAVAGGIVAAVMFSRRGE